MTTDQSISLLTKPQMAELLGISLPTATRLLNAGEFPKAFRVFGKNWRIPPEDVHAFMKREAEKAHRPVAAA